MTGLDIANAVLALLLVLGLIGGLAWLLRRAGGLPGLARNAVQRGERRLKIEESQAIDTRHRLVLVSRDGVEHLLLLGPSGTTLVEGGIGAEGARRGTAESKPGGLQ